MCSGGVVNMWLDLNNMRLNGESKAFFLIEVIIFMAQTDEGILRVLFLV